MSLSRYWPVRDEINRCIKAEAEAAPDAVLMAVHQPMPLIRRELGSGLEDPTTEQELLDAFLSDNLPQGTLLMPITGPSGAGKSHLIRWLAAQIGRDARASRMHVIRIPKSANLRTVVELMLEPLAGDGRFEDVRSNLNKAVAAIKPQNAAVLFSGALEIELGEFHQRLMAELRAMPRDDVRFRALSSRAHHAKNLPGLFGDAELRGHMIEKVLAPIIQRAVSGQPQTGALQHTDPDRDASGQAEVEPLPQFRAADLDLPDGLRGALGHAAMQVRSYYQNGLNRANGKGREEAASVLNEVVDQAIRQVFGLHQAIGGITLEEIILQIRKLMLQDNRELVLLVEDFAALGGIQQVLLDVCIKEAVYEGCQTLSRMRTALALTDGYLVGRDTVSTRAKYEWVIQSRGNREDVLGRTTELVGAYLNAARWGEDELKRRFQETEIEAALTGWVEVFQDPSQTPETAEQLKDFGLAASGVPLFPLNDSSLRLLAARHLQEAGELRFNPRKVINFLLLDVLLLRDDFEQGAFPLAGFKGAVPSAGIANWLNGMPLSEDVRGRLAALLVFWGGSPETPDQAVGMADGLFTAFGLQHPAGLPEARTRPVRQQPTNPAPPRIVEPAPPSSRQESILVDWRKKLDGWTSGPEGELNGPDANLLRSTLKKIVENAIPWNELRMRKRPLSLLLTIPNARGNESPAAIRIPLADGYSDPTGDLRLTLLGALRLDRAKGGLNYPEADEDSARLATLVERLVAKLVPQLEELRDQEVKILAWVLAQQARVLGLVPRQRMSKLEARMRAVLATAKSPEPVGSTPPPDEPRWQRLRREAATQRPEMTRMLLDRIGCFQGSGPTPYAVDPTIVDLANETDAPDLKWLSATQREHCQQLSPTRVPAASRPQVEAVRKLSTRLDALLGPDRDKQRLVNELNALIDVLQPVGVWPDGYPLQGFRREIEAFRASNLMEQLGEARPLLDARNYPNLASDDTLERLGRIEFAIIGRAEAFLNRAEAFLNGAEQTMTVKEGGLAGVDPAVDAQALAEALDQVHRDLCTLTGRKHT